MDAGIIEEIRKEIGAFPKLPEDHLLRVHKALFSPFDKDTEWYEPQVTTPRPKPTPISEEDTPKEIIRLLRICEKGGAKAMWMRTGLSVKVENAEGYSLNICNYVSVRVREGQMNGLLTFNQVRMSGQIEELGLPEDEIDFIKGYVCIKAIAVDLVEDMLKKHIKLLVRQGKDALEAKKAKASSMKKRMK